MITPAEFIDAWGEDDPLVRYPVVALRSLHLPADAVAFLSQAGLPQSAAPFLNFEAPSTAQIRSVAEVYGLSEPFRRYYRIGFNGSGDPIAVDDKDAGVVVYLNHDNRFDVVRISTSISQLAESLLAYRDMVRKTLATNGPEAFLDGNIPLDVICEAEAALWRIDEASMNAGGMWVQEISSLKAESGN